MSHIQRRSQSTRTASALSRRMLLKVAAGLGSAAATGVLGACGSPGTGGGAGTGHAKHAPIKLPPEVAGPHFKQGYKGPRTRELKPFADGSKTFTVVVGQDATTIGDWNNNKTTAWFQQKTGVKIKFKQIDTSDTSKLNAILSSGDLPDAFMGMDLSRAQISLYGQQGLFVGLDDLINTVAPRTQQMMKEYPGLRALTAATDNKMYAMPSVNDCFHCRSSGGRVWIHQGYLDKVGGTIPTTTDELRQVLLEFKNKNPSGKAGFVPFAAGVDNDLDPYFMQPFTYNPGSGPNWLRLNNGKVEFAANTDEWRDALRYLRQLNKDGLIDDQTFAMTGAEMQQAGNKQQLGMVRAAWWGQFFTTVNLDAKAPWRNYVPVPPVKGPNGTRTAMWDHFGYGGTGLLITSKCTDPETLVRWSDAQLDLQATMQAYDGIQDKNWFWADEGTKGIDGEQAVWRDVTWPAPVNTSWGQKSTMYRSLDFRNGQMVDPKAPTFEAGLFAAGKVYEPYAEPEDQQLPPLIIPDEDAAAEADIATSLSQGVKQAVARFALGKLDIDKDGDWKNYVDAFTQMKLPQMIDIYQRAYDKRPH